MSCGRAHTYRHFSRRCRMRHLRAWCAIAIVLPACGGGPPRDDGGASDQDLGDEADLSSVADDMDHSPPDLAKMRDMAGPKDFAPPPDLWRPPDLTPCPGGTVSCPSGCSNLNGDPQNCGSCGTQCGMGLVC